MDKIKKFSKWLDAKLPFNEWIGGIVGGAAEAIDGFFLEQMLRLALSKADDETKEEIEDFLEAIADGDYEKVKGVSSDFLVKKLNTKLGDARERIIIGNAIIMIQQLIELEIKETN